MTERQQRIQDLRVEIEACELELEELEELEKKETDNIQSDLPAYEQCEAD